MNYNKQLTEHFNLSEFISPNDNTVELTDEIINNLTILSQQLEVIRTHLGQPITINSGYRSKEHNKAVGGVKNSQHLLGKAGDLRSNDSLHLSTLIKKLMDEDLIKKGGIGLYKNFVHYDWRGVYKHWID